jgi:hypothetical protein
MAQQLHLLGGVFPLHRLDDEALGANNGPRVRGLLILRFYLRGGRHQRLAQRAAALFVALPAPAEALNAALYLGERGVQGVLHFGVAFLSAQQGTVGPHGQLHHLLVGPAAGALFADDYFRVGNMIQIAREPADFLTDHLFFRGSQLAVFGF